MSKTENPASPMSESDRAKLGARARTDPAFKAKLLADPAAALSTMGVFVPAGVTVKVVENTAALVHLILPSLPGDGRLAEADLDAVVGGLTKGDQYTLF